MAYDPPMVNPTGKHRPKRRHHGEGSRAFRVHDARRQRPWRCDLRMGRDPVTGKLRTRSFWGTSAHEAEHARDEYRDRLRRSGTPEAAERTVDALLTAWLASRDVDPSTADRYRGVVQHHLSPTLGLLLVADLTERDVEAARASWRRVRIVKGIPVPGGPLSPSSSNLVLGVLRDALGPSIRHGVLPDPTADVAPRRRAASPARYLDQEQARTLLTALEGDPLALLVTVAVTVGPRRGELLGMRWRDLDLDAGTCTAGLQLRRIPPSHRHEGESPYRLVEPKASGSMGRVVSLPAFVVAALLAHRDAQDAALRRQRVRARNGLVFADELGQALPPGSVTRRFEQLAKRAGLGHVRFHDLRHSSATLMLAMGVPERVVQEILGHASAATTRGYMKVVRRLGADAAERMNEAMGNVG